MAAAMRCTWIALIDSVAMFPPHSASSVEVRCRRKSSFFSMIVVGRYSVAKSSSLEMPSAPASLMKRNAWAVVLPPTVSSPPSSTTSGMRARWRSRSSKVGE